MTYQLILNGASNSFPAGHAFLDNAVGTGVGMVFLGADAGVAYQAAAQATPPATWGASFVAIELGMECLGVHLGNDNGPDNVVGFARFRLGQAEPTNLVELVRMPNTTTQALAAARQAIEASGLKVAVCQDFPGRIINRLVRPYYNAALRRLDEGLATAADMDTTLRLGLGYPEGPIALLSRTGLPAHFEVTRDLYEQLGQEPNAPARRARNAWLRTQQAEAGDATT